MKPYSSYMFLYGKAQWKYHAPSKVLPIGEMHELKKFKFLKKKKKNKAELT